MNDTARNRTDNGAAACPAKDIIQYEKQPDTADIMLYAMPKRCRSFPKNTFAGSAYALKGGLTALPYNDRFRFPEHRRTGIKGVSIVSENAYHTVGYHFSKTVPLKNPRFGDGGTVHLAYDVPADLAYPSDVFRFVAEAEITFGVRKYYLLAAAVHKISDIAEKVFMEAFKRKFQKYMIRAFYAKLFKIRIR